MVPDSFKNTDYSRKATQVVFDRLRNRFPKGSWLGAGNRYCKDCTETIAKDCKLVPNGIRDLQLAEYIAASAPLHCMDGWSLLGKAVASHAMGDTAACRHFAYYAELRAAMSLLAGEGIGVFNNKHFSIVSSTKSKVSLIGPISKSTHPLVKLQFEAWAKSTASYDLCDNIIRPRGRPLRDWISMISSTRLSWVAQDWMLQWGYDLTQITTDHNARNQASYRPDGLRKDSLLRNASDILKSMEIVESIWRMCMLEGGGMPIDMYLLRRSWEDYAKRNKLKLTASFIKGVLKKDGTKEPALTNLAEFLSRKSQSIDPLLLRSAAKRGSIHDSDYHIQMMSRATLLLRLATGASANMMRQARFTKQELEFWWQPFGENRGLWESGLSDPIENMWFEVDEALQSMSDRRSEITDHYEWRVRLAREVLTLSGCEKIGLGQLCA